MRRLNFLFLAVVAVLLNACQPANNPPDPSETQELVGRWNAVKIVMDGETYTEDLEFVFFEFYENKTCIFNIEGFEGDDVEANYFYSDGVLKLSDPDDASEYLLCEVEKLTETELVLNFPPLEADEDSFTIYYQKAQ